MSVHERLRGVLRQVFPEDTIEITDDFGPMKYEGWDSVATINLMFMIEQEFEVQFVGTKFLEFVNVGEIRNYLERVAA